MSRHDDEDEPQSPGHRLVVPLVVSLGLAALLTRGPVTLLFAILACLAALPLIDAANERHH